MAFRALILLTIGILLFTPSNAEAQDSELGVSLSFLGIGDSPSMYTGVGVSYRPARSNFVLDSAVNISEGWLILDPLLNLLSDSEDEIDVFGSLDRLEAGVNIGYVFSNNLIFDEVASYPKIGAYIWSDVFSSEEDIGYGFRAAIRLNISLSRGGNIVSFMQPATDYGSINRFQVRNEFGIMLRN